ncbi:MAG: hypothetical protein ACLSEY_18485 [Enterocloster sp.]
MTNEQLCSPDQGRGRCGWGIWPGTDPGEKALFIQWPGSTKVCRELEDLEQEGFLALYDAIDQSHLRQIRA